MYYATCRQRVCGQNKDNLCLQAERTLIWRSCAFNRGTMTMPVLDGPMTMPVPRPDSSTTALGSAPTYFHSLIQIYIPSRSLRSASERRLVVPSQRGSKSLSRTFSFTIPGWWNDLPTPIRNAGSLSIFKQQLKTHLFQHYLTSS